MTTQSRMQKVGWILLSAAVGLTVVLLWWYFSVHRAKPDGQADSTVPKSPLEARPKKPVAQTLELSENMVRAMQLKTVPAVVPSISKVLHLRGSLAIDPNRLSHVHARFPGQIVELGTIAGLRSDQSNSAAANARLLQTFDSVTEGMKMAVLQSKDLGEKKSELESALTQLRVEETTLSRLEELFRQGGTPERSVREQEAKVRKYKIDAFTAEQTLRAFKATEQEINELKDWVQNTKRDPQSNRTYAAEWSRVVVSSPINGVIVEKSVIAGDIVDANADLFKIADLSVLAVYLHPYEEDLQVLDDLPKPLYVQIRVPAFPELGELQCEVDHSSPMIDPNEHMALLIGKVKNPDGKLKANQFVTANVGTPVEKGVVEIPANSVIDLGSEAIVYVQPDSSIPSFLRRRVVIVERYFDVVYVRSELTDDQKKQDLQEIHAGDSVVRGWILEMEDYLQQQQ